MRVSWSTCARDREGEAKERESEGWREGKGGGGGGRERSNSSRSIRKNLREISKRSAGLLSTNSHCLDHCGLTSVAWYKIKYGCASARA